ncbi:MAG: tRNA (N6-isopentenyl adenosine(37)-C2)-methylthiotransferase MiaB [Bdellovibrionales bacterium]
MLDVSKAMQGVFITTYGCQMNVNDSERMFSLLEMQNYEEVKKPDQADLIIINSCSVREKPVHKVHSEVGRYRELKKENPSLIIGVGGCVGQQEKKKLLADIPLLDFVFGPDNIDNLPNLISEVRQKDDRIAKAKFDYQSPYQVETLVRNPGVSTFVNITKGCDNFCTFCVVPFTRGRERSRALKDLIGDVQTLVKRGVKEVTLLGQNVNSYTSECGANFAQLMKAVAEDTDVERIRFTTSHPKDFDQELCDVLQAHREKLCDYIHLPVQSGSSLVLDRMNRRYTREHYLEKIQMIKETIPDVSLSTDIIVGFPGETDQDFEDTMSIVHEVAYETIFAFKYSPRPFTKAARFEDQVDEKIKSERLTRLFAEHRDLAFELVKKYNGMTLDVLVEAVDRKDPTRVFGRSSQNKLVHFTGSEELIGSTVPIKIDKVAPINFSGVMVN